MRTKCAKLNRNSSQIFVQAFSKFERFRRSGSCLQKTKKNLQNTCSLQISALIFCIRVQWTFQMKHQNCVCFPMKLKFIMLEQSLQKYKATKNYQKFPQSRISVEFNVYASYIDILNFRAKFFENCGILNFNAKF